MSKPDLIIAAVSNVQWLNICPFANSIVKSGFLETDGQVVILASGMDQFTTDCLRQRDFEVIPFRTSADAHTFITKTRFEVLLEFLKKYGEEYRYVIWVDVNDLIFQSNPTDWLDSLTQTPVLVAASEVWRVKDEPQFNVPWVRNTTPDDFEWLQHMPICCGGTIAADVQTMMRTVERILELVTAHPSGNDQAALTYIVHKPFEFPIPTYVRIPPMDGGWAVTCSAFDTHNFKSPIGIPDTVLYDNIPIFDLDRGIVYSPRGEGDIPFVIVHQYNRDPRWNDIIRKKYGEI
jgi:hypothetical protein